MLPDIMPEDLDAAAPVRMANRRGPIRRSEIQDRETVEVEPLNL